MNEFFIMLETMRGAGWVYLWVVLVLAVGFVVSEIRPRKPATQRLTKGTETLEHPEDEEEERLAA